MFVLHKRQTVAIIGHRDIFGIENKIYTEIEKLIKIWYNIHRKSGNP